MPSWAPNPSSEQVLGGLHEGGIVGLASKIPAENSPRRGERQFLNSPDCDTEHPVLGVVFVAALRFPYLSPSGE
jgi:hypothetical protein